MKGEREIQGERVMKVSVHRVGRVEVGEFGAEEGGLEFTEARVQAEDFVVVADF